MHKLEKLKENIMGELEGFADAKLTREGAETVKYLASAYDHLNNICDHEEGGYSMDGRSYGIGRYYNRGRSYAGRRGARRDSMGRYSSDGYSMADSGMIDDLRDMMEDAPAGAKQKFQKLINELENM